MYTILSKEICIMKKIDENINKVFKRQGGFARTKDILAAGIHTRNIKRIRDEGLINREGKKSDF